MSDQVQTETQADSVDQSQADTTSQTETQAVEESTVSLEDMKKVRSEAANLRKRLKEAEAKVSEFETANQSDEEKRKNELATLQERATKAEQALRTANARNAVFGNAGNTTDAELLYLYIEKQGIEFDEDGNPANVKELIEQARKDKPALFQRGSADGAARNGTAVYEPKPGMERLTHAYEQAANKR